jgi:uncharacterized zinc-type alcohol dehydrogenase-like protein
MDKYLSLLRLNGTMVNVGCAARSHVGAGLLPALAAAQLGRVRNRRHRQTQEMLDFCAEHNLGAEIEVISGDQIDEAWDRMVAGDVRYRFVIDTAAFE